MSVTYTTAAERDTHRLWRDARRGWPEPLLAVTSCVAALAIVLACIGRLRAFDESEVGGAGARVVNLNTVRDAAVLEPALGAAFANANDRRFAAVELFRFLSGDGQRTTLAAERRCRFPGDGEYGRRPRRETPAGVRRARAPGPGRSRRAARIHPPLHLGGHLEAEAVSHRPDPRRVPASGMAVRRALRARLPCRRASLAAAAHPG